MDRLIYLFVWLSRITHCRGFGIQSPTDYWLVRYVINEHWPYYQYDSLGQDDDWLTRKLGRLYFRIANWLQPNFIESNKYHDYLLAGCKRSLFGPSSELIIINADINSPTCFSYIYNKVEDGAVLVVDGIDKDKGYWQRLISGIEHCISFDLYYCGIVMYDKKRHQQHYIINF